MSAAETLFESILKGKPAPGIEAVRQAIAEGMPPHEIINDHMVRAMEEIGRRFEQGQAFVPELLMSALAMKKSLELLKPLMKGDDSAFMGKIVLGTVEGDLHDIGKNLVSSMLEGCGFEVVNLGTNISSDKFINAIHEHQPDIIGMSALLTTTMPYMKTVIDAVVSSGLRDKVRIMIGGAPVTEDFARSIGADGYSRNANAAVSLARSLVGVSA